jgi:hypothetical protein
MAPKIVTAAAVAALCLGSFTPAIAQSSAYSTFDAPRGTSATVNLRVPLGAEPGEKKASYGFTFGYGQTVGSPELDGRTRSREMRFADIRFAEGKLAQANVVSFDLANLDEDPRMNMIGAANTAIWLVGAVVIGGLVCWAAGCFDDEDDEDDITTIQSTE